jgi:hypothetical protein
LGFLVDEFFSSLEFKFCFFSPFLWWRKNALAGLTPRITDGLRWRVFDARGQV